MERKVKLSKQTEKDLQNISDYYNQISFELALDTFFHISKNLEALKTFPLLGKEIENNKRRIALRKYKYNIYYSIKKETIFVYRILHASQDASILIRLR